MIVEASTVRERLTNVTKKAMIKMIASAQLALSMAHVLLRLKEDPLSLCRP